MRQTGPEGESGEGETSHLEIFYEDLGAASSKQELEERLVPLEDKEALTAFNLLEIFHGQQSLPGIGPILTPIRELDVKDIPLGSPFEELYYDSGKLNIWSFNPGVCEPEEGMFLIAVRAERTRDRFNWNVGWVTVEEFASLFQEV